MGYPVVKGVSYILAHTPDLVRYGSKPAREIPKEPDLLDKIQSHLRSYEDAVAYPAHQAFLGAMRPEALWDIERPWFHHPLEGAQRFGPFGEIMPQSEFYGLMKVVDEFDLVKLAEGFTEKVRLALSNHFLVNDEDLERLGIGVSLEELQKEIAGGALPLYENAELVGCFLSGHDEDENLTAAILMENLACKASGVLALRHLLNSFGPGAAAIDYMMNCGEEGVGDRYQRGAGNLAKAMAEKAGCVNCSGADVKAFCCAPVHTMVLAASLVQAGVFKEVVVVGGGALAKLGMKMRGHLAKSIPIMEDVLGAFAVVVGQDDGINPRIRLDAVGKHEVAASSAQQAIMESLVFKPLDRVGLKITDIDKYATEMHNPEITEPAGSGNTPRGNYRMIGGLAVMHKLLTPSDLDDFEHTRGMPGFAPTQGHIPSALPFLGHARQRMLKEDLRNTMFLGKGSLFLAKMTKLSDGMSFILERNGG
jgi:betaine reductase